MANVLTDLAADIYKAADTVGRELTGAVSSVIVNGNGSERVAKGDVVRSHFTRQPSASGAISEAMTIPEGTDQTVDNKTLTISKAQSIQIPWTGEVIKHVDNGSGFESVYGDQLVQAMRTLTNEIEADLLSDIYQNASRAHGTAGTTPFGSNFNELANLRKIMVDNGCPVNDRMLTAVMNTNAGVNLRNLAQLQKANESASDSLLRQGTLLDLQGLMLKESAGVQSHTKGTGASYVTNGTFAVGDTTVSIDGGTGTVLAGDVVTFTGDTNKYVVISALSGGDIVIGGPGLQQSLADGVAMTVGASYTGNVAFHRNAAELVIRAPAVPNGGDAADDSMVVQDPWSGLVFEVRSYKGYRKAMFEVAVAYGYKTWKPDFVATLLG